MRPCRLGPTPAPHPPPPPIRPPLPSPALRGAMCVVCRATPPLPQLVPERGDAHEDRVYHFCPLCLDEMLAAFPLHPARFLARELTGVYPTRVPAPPPPRRAPAPPPPPPPPRVTPRVTP